MTITDITQAWSATKGATNNKGREYTASYNVETDSYNDQVKTIIDYFATNTTFNGLAIPYLNKPYQFGNDLDVMALCDSVTPSRVSGSQYNWTVDFHYKTADQEEDETQEDESGNASNNPMDWNWTVDISYADYSRPVTHATYRGGHTGDNFLDVFNTGDGADQAIIPPMNSAGTVFDPALERSALRQVFRFGKYRHEYPDGMADNWRAVNSKAFGIKVKDPNVVNKNGRPRTDKTLISWNFEPFQCQVVSANASVVRQNNMTVWKISSEIHADYEFGYRVKIADRGIVALGNAGAPDGIGGSLSSGNPASTGIPEDRTMRDVLGNTLAEPVLLDGNGQPLAKGLPAVYLEWSIYPEIDFGDFNEWLPIR